MIPVNTMTPMYPSLASPIRAKVEDAAQFCDMLQMHGRMCRVSAAVWNSATGCTFELVPVELPVISIDAVNAIRRVVAMMTNGERLAVLKSVTEGYCTACGDILPCFCERDD